MSYLVIPRMRVEGVNIVNSSLLIGGPPVLAAYFMAHALGRKLGEGVRVQAVALVVHQYTPLGESFYGIFHPQLRRGAAFTFGPSLNSTDYSSKNKQALSLQPVASAHMCVTLIIKVDTIASLEPVDSFLSSGRLAGGTIRSHGELLLRNDLDGAFAAINSGFVVMDRRDLLEKAAGTTRAEQFVAALGHKAVKGDGLEWLAATCVGHAAITPFEHRSGVREGYEHAFSEPLLGLVQYVSVRQCKEAALEQCLWHPNWMQADVFRLYQERS